MRLMGVDVHVDPTVERARHKNPRVQTKQRLFYSPQGGGQGAHALAESEKREKGGSGLKLPKKSATLPQNRPIYV